MPVPRPSALVLAAVALVAVTGLACAGSRTAERRFEAYPQAEVIIGTRDGPQAFRAWIADTPARRTQGLMFVERLDPDRGMLFLFEQPQFAAFWMKDTPVSLDLLFIGQDGHIINIGERARPYSTTLITSARPVVAVLEVAAGTAARLAIRPGDRVTHSAPGNPPAR